MIYYTMRIVVQTLQSKPFEIEADSTDTIDTLKLIIRGAKPIDWNTHRLHFQGADLSKGTVLANGIVDGSTVRVLRSGSGPRR